MIDFSPTKGCTVYGIAGFSDHLIIICTDPVFFRDYGCEAVLSVNVTTWNGLAYNDASCILDVGDHPFIKHKSFAFYKQSVPLRVPSLIEKVQSGDLIPMGVLSDSVLQKVLDGFEKSNQTPLKSLRFLELIKKELG